MKKYKTKKKRKIPLKWKFLIFIIIFVFLSCIYLTNVVNPLIVNINKSTIEHNAVSAINSAVSATISTGLYDDLIQIQKNEAGDVILITSNSARINALSDKILNDCQTNLTNIENSSFDVALFTFTGLSFLNGLGPLVTIKTTPIGHATAKYISKFQSSGINQTLHQIYITISANICVLMPLNSFEITVSHQVLVAESVIIGKIPEMYLNGSLFGNSLNLVP